jgi:hypothetical protein
MGSVLATIYNSQTVGKNFINEKGNMRGNNYSSLTDTEALLLVRKEMWDLPPVLTELA